MIDSDLYLSPMVVKIIDYSNLGIFKLNSKIDEDYLQGSVFALFEKRKWSKGWHWNIGQRYNYLYILTYMFCTWRGDVSFVCKGTSCKRSNILNINIYYLMITFVDSWVDFSICLCVFHCFTKTENMLTQQFFSIS